MSGAQDDFQMQAQEKRASLTQEFIGFMADNKKWWMLPIVVCLVLLTCLVLFAGSGAAPFIYTLF